MAFDGFVFCGGGDIDPRYYGEGDKLHLKNICSIRDGFEAMLFNAAFKTGKSILGICRGMQVINVFMGGNLYQHIDGHMQSDARNIPTHDITLLNGGVLRSIIMKDKIMVNSFHHQAVKHLAPDLAVDAISPDGHIEAFHANWHKFLLGVQWHPEACFKLDDSSERIFRAFIEACKSGDEGAKKQGPRL